MESIGRFYQSRQAWKSKISVEATEGPKGDVWLANEGMFVAMRMYLNALTAPKAIDSAFTSNYRDGNCRSIQPAAHQNRESVTFALADRSKSQVSTLELSQMIAGLRTPVSDTELSQEDLDITSNSDSIKIDSEFKLSTDSLDPFEASVVPLSASTRDRLSFCKYLDVWSLSIPFIVDLDAINQHAWLCNLSLIGIINNVDAEKTTPTIFPIPILALSWNQNTIPQCLIEPALLHVTLSVIEGTLATVYGFAPSFARIEQNKIASIRLINQKLHDTTQTTMLSTIFTVICLLALEAS